MGVSAGHNPPMADELVPAEIARDLAKCKADEVLAIGITRTSAAILRMLQARKITAKECVQHFKSLAYARNQLNGRLLTRMDRDDAPPSPEALAPGSSASVLAELRQERLRGTTSGSESTPGTPVPDTD